MLVGKTHGFVLVSSDQRWRIHYLNVEAHPFSTSSQSGCPVKNQVCETFQTTVRFVEILLVQG